MFKFPGIGIAVPGGWSFWRTERLIVFGESFKLHGTVVIIHIITIVGQEIAVFFRADQEEGKAIFQLGLKVLISPKLFSSIINF